MIRNKVYMNRLEWILYELEHENIDVVKKRCKRELFYLSDHPLSRFMKYKTNVDVMKYLVNHTSRKSSITAYGLAKILNIDNDRVRKIFLRLYNLGYVGRNYDEYKRIITSKYYYLKPLEDLYIGLEEIL